MINRNSTLFVSGCGFGDMLFALNKFKQIAGSNSRLSYLTDQDETLKLAPEFFRLNGISTADVVRVTNLNDNLLNIKSKNITLSTVWNGDTSINEGQRTYINSDHITITPFMELHGDEIGVFMPKPYFIAQFMAGNSLQHGVGKNWNSIETFKTFVYALCKHFDIMCYVIGAPLDCELDPALCVRFNSKDFQSIEYIKRAKFTVGLTSFVSFCSLFLNVPTIYKVESSLVDEHYFGHPEWQPLMCKLEELTTEEIQKAKMFIEEKCFQTKILAP